MKLWKALKLNRGRLAAEGILSGFSVPRSRGSVSPRQKRVIWSKAADSTPVVVDSRHKQPEPVEDPMQQTIYPRPRMNKWARFFRWSIRMINHPSQFIPWCLEFFAGPITMVKKLNPWRPLTEEEKYYKAELLRRKKLAKVLERESQLYWDGIVRCLDRYGMKHRPSREESGGGMRFTRHVSFDRVVLTPEAIWFRVNTARLPYGVSIPRLMDREIIQDLSIAVRHQVRGEYTVEKGAWYFVERGVGTRGIPDHVRFMDLLNAMPASADPLTIPIGIGLNKKLVYKSLGRMYSMLVGGTIGGGKSNFLNVILLTLIRRNPPDRLKLILIDLKGGLEFQFYEGIPHLMPIPTLAEGGIADKNEQVPGILQWLKLEGERRMQVLRAAEQKSIGMYNAHRKQNRMPHILLVIDEFADIMYNKKISGYCEETMANIAQRFRAVGIHVILCTQVPKKEVISTRIKGVLPAKIAFSTTNNTASMVILDNINAKELRPAGRAIFQWDQELEVQTPFINESIIEEIVTGAKQGKYEKQETRHDVTQLEVMEYALSEENGFLNIQRIYKQFSGRGITREELEKWFSEWDNQEIIIGTGLYKCVPPAGSRARRLIAIDEDADDREDQSGEEVGGEEEKKQQVTIDQIIEYSLIYLNGSLSRDRLYERFRNSGITRHELDDILWRNEGNTFAFGSSQYLLEPASGTRARRLKKLQG